jgi:hypothetical protein
MKSMNIITSKIIAHVFGRGVSLLCTALYLLYSVRPSNRRDDLTCLQLNAAGVTFFRTSEFLSSYLTHPRRKKRANNIFVSLFSLQIIPPVKPSTKYMFLIQG